ncbi:hypothetical protein [Streptomyces sp. A5-4]|uniref:hypothetical protein n=1 Tax=Streptomyces sp. A5-4 TaxID=3384771 RepID=UPI003DA94410
MSGSDQEGALGARADTPPKAQAQAPAELRAETGAETSAAPRVEGSAETAESPAPARPGRAPSQARRLRMAAASVLMLALAVVLVVRLASRSSVLVVGVYGLALILCGVVVELSRRGRTRLGSWLLGVGLLAALAADRFLIP